MVVGDVGSRSTLLLQSISKVSTACTSEQGIVVGAPPYACEAYLLRLTVGRSNVDLNLLNITWSSWLASLAL